MKGVTRVLALLTLAGTTFTVLAGNMLLTANSTLVATFKQAGVPVDAPFKTFSGQINYDPATPTKATAVITVDTASLDLGDPGYSAEVRKKAWFDSATYPKATFQSTAVKADAPNKLTATGTLTLKGRVQTITVPITVGKSAAGTTFDGTLTISRKAFGIGNAEWDEVLEDAVKVRFHLVNPASTSPMNK